MCTYYVHFRAGSCLQPNGMTGNTIQKPWYNTYPNARSFTIMAKPYTKITTANGSDWPYVVHVACGWPAWCKDGGCFVLLWYFTCFVHSLHVAWLMSIYWLPGVCKNSKFYTDKIHVLLMILKLPTVPCTIGKVSVSKLQKNESTDQYNSICIDEYISSAYIMIHGHMVFWSTALWTYMTEWLHLLITLHGEVNNSTDISYIWLPVWLVHFLLKYVKYK